MRTAFTITVRIGTKVETYTVEVENAGKRDAFRILKERLLRSKRRKSFKIIRVERLDK